MPVRSSFARIGTSGSSTSRSRRSIPSEASSVASAALSSPTAWARRHQSRQSSSASAEVSKASCMPSPAGRLSPPVPSGRSSLRR